MLNFLLLKIVAFGYNTSFLYWKKKSIRPVFVRLSIL